MQFSSNGGAAGAAGDVPAEGALWRKRWVVKNLNCDDNGVVAEVQQGGGVQRHE